MLFISAASWWEMTIKAGLGKLTLPDRIDRMIYQAEKAEIYTLAIQAQHLAVLSDLPAHHSDPFDRMLVAQAISESLTLITRDNKMQTYQVPVIWQPVYYRSCGIFTTNFPGTGIVHIVSHFARFL